jgi:vanillate O-demethylase ferredoxin subunit
MLEAFRGATASLPSENVHFEYFSGIEPPVASEGYTVELARSKRSVVIPPGKTILDVLIALGMDVGHSCMEGVCGACETKVLEGRPDHHDLVLSEAERNSNATMMICCSGSATERLVLDL